MKTRYIIAPIVMLAILAALSTPAMAGNVPDELETRCWNNNCLNGTTNGTVIVLCNMTGLPTVGNWTITLPQGEVVVAYVHWHRWGACHGTDPTAEFWNGTGAYESISFPYPDEDTEVYEDHGVWFTDFSPRNGNHHYYWKVNASAGDNIFNATGCYETSGEHCDARWFFAVINGTDNVTHSGHWWHNTGYRKTEGNNPPDVTQTEYLNASNNPINTSANYSLWTAQSHYGSSTPSIEFNGVSVGNVGSGCDGHGDGEYGDFSLCEFNVNNTLIETDGDQLVTWKDDGDAYYVNFGTLAEKIPPQVSGQPDLVVEDIMFPEVMNPGTSYTIKARIKNQGDAGTGNTFNVSLYVNDVLNSTKQTLSSLNAGSSTEASFTGVSLSKGCYDFKVVADVDGDITESNENNNATSEWYQVDNVIVVHNNSDLINKADRNESSTYYIENRTITNCAGNGITIENTTLPFVILNCTVHDCNCKAAAQDPAGIFLHNVTNGKIGDYSNRNTIENNTNAGIRVKNSTYVDITDNTIQNNTLYGIYAYPRALPATSETRDDCKYINVTNNTVTENGEAVDLIAYNCTVKNNTITDNTKFGIYMMGNYSNITYNNITDNTDYGVKLYNCSGNYVYENNFTDNNVTGHQAWDNKATNYWNTTEAGKNYTGNRWNDWQNNSGFPGSYEIDGGDNEDKRPKGLYDFLTGENTDKWAYRWQINQTEFDSSSPIYPSTEFSSVEYARIKVNDENRQDDSSNGEGYYAAHRFNFSISEDPNDISKINVTWNGIGEHEQANLDDGATLYIRNFTSGNYTLLQESEDTDAEVTLTGEVTSGMSNYINAGIVTVLVNQTNAQTTQGNNIRKSWIKTDYVRVAICAAP